MSGPTRYPADFHKPLSEAGVCEEQRKHFACAHVENLVEVQSPRFLGLVHSILHWWKQTREQRN